jgi:hypothetical protein
MKVSECSFSYEVESLKAEEDERERISFMKILIPKIIA